MALTFGTGLTNLTEANDATGFSGFSDAGGGGSPTPAQNTDVFIQGTGSVSAKISGAGRIKAMMYDNGQSPPVDMSVAGRHFYIYIASTILSVTDTWANGGIAIRCASDAAGTTDWAKWYVGGGDKVGQSSGLVRYCVDLTKTPSENPASFDVTAVRWFGASVSITGTAGNLQNFIIDRMDYGQGAMQVIGDGTLVAGYQDMADEDADINNKYGLLVEEDGVFFALGGIKVGDAAQSATTEFDDATGATIQFRNPVYHDGTTPDLPSVDGENLYIFSAEGAASFKTILKLGNVVGSGDDRQGVQGGSIGSAGPAWLLDMFTDIADLTSVDLLGVNIQGARAGILLDDGSKSSIVSCAFVNCGTVNPGTVNDGAEILSCAIIDPNDLNEVENRGLVFPQTPVGSPLLLSHNLKKISFITSGNPSIQHMIHLPFIGDYTIVFNAFIFFGDFAPGSPIILWHGENSGAGADVTINTLNDSNPNADEFEITSASPPGTVIVVATAALKITVTNFQGDLQGGANCRYQESDGTTLLNGTTGGDGIFQHTIDVGDLPLTNARIIARKEGFEDFRQNLNIPVSGFDIPVTLAIDPEEDLP